MDIGVIVSKIDKEIGRLTQVRNRLTNNRSGAPSTPVLKRRTLSAAARKRIGDTQRERLALHTKAGSK
jgi:hypothetical protein